MRKHSGGSVCEVLAVFVMKKAARTALIFAIFTLCALYSFCFSASALAVEDSSLKIIIDGVPLETHAPPFMEKDEIMVPVLDLAFAMGLYTWQFPDDDDMAVDDEVYGVRLFVNFFGERSSLSISGSNGIRVTSDFNRSWYNHGNYVKPIKIGDYVYVPLHPFADVFSFDVQWDKNTNTATLTNRLNTSFWADKSADTPYSVLNNRFTIYLPEGAEAQHSRYYGIMGSEADAEHETNLVLTGNDQTLEVKISELHVYSTGDLEKDALIFIEMLKNRYRNSVVEHSVSGVMTAENISFISITPDVSDHSNGYLIESALVLAGDNTLLFAEIYADKKALAYPEDCRNLAQQIIASIQGGTRLLAVDGQSFSLGDFTIELAPGYVPMLNCGPDFDVWYFNKLTLIGEVGSSFGMYRGNFPSYGTSMKPTQTVMDIVLSRIITWRLDTEIPGEFDKNTSAATLIRTGIIGWDTYMHIFASPVSEADWEGIRAMVRSLKDTNGTATLIIWGFYGLIVVAVIGIVLLVVRKKTT